MGMDALDFSSSLKALDILESQEYLKALRCQDWDKLKPDVRRKEHKEISKIAFSQNKKETVKNSDLVNSLGAIYGR